MKQELSRRLGYTITYFLAAIVLFWMYRTYETAFAMLGGVVCLLGGIVYLIRYLTLKQRDDSE